MKKFSLLIQWSEEDGCYLATCPELRAVLVQPCTHGDTWEEAGKMAAEAIGLIVEEFEERKAPLPEPETFKSVSEMSEAIMNRYDNLFRKLANEDSDRPG